MTKSQKTNRAIFLGECDAKAGRDYANPYTPPSDADETYVWNADCEEAYHWGYISTAEEMEAV